MKQKRIVIIGAVAAGTKTAAKARREAPNADITLITDEAEISYASCGTPYFISDMIKESHSLIVRTPDYFQKMLNIKVLEEDEIKRFEADANGNITNVVTKKRTVPAELVLLAIGTKPNIQMAKEAGVAIGQTGAICVNEKMETNIPDIYAVGDCVETIHLITNKPAWIPLATTSNKQGRCC